MYLIQILIPLYNNKGEAFPKNLFDSVKKELTQVFGGVTVFARSPATGLWKESDEKIIQDEIILFEIMIDDINGEFWRGYKVKLENIFHQHEIIIRALPMQLL